jgi:predicted transcriptional regulator
MQRSKLEMYIDLLEILVYDGSVKLSHLMRKANISYRVLMRLLAFLIKQELVEERVLSDSRLYVITQKGMTTIRCFREMECILPARE